MLHDLLQHELGDWHPRRFLRTPALLKQQKQSLSAFDAWWVELLETGELEGAEPGAPNRAVSNAYDEENTDGNYTRTGKHAESTTRLDRLSRGCATAATMRLGTIWLTKAAQAKECCAGAAGSFPNCWCAARTGKTATPNGSGATRRSRCGVKSKRRRSPEIPAAGRLRFGRRRAKTGATTNGYLRCAAYAAYAAR